MSQPQPEPPWYSEEAGFFGPNYLEEYAHVLPPERTEREVAFVDNIMRTIPSATVLDLCCGHGRHAIELAKRNYKVTGGDLNQFFLDEARRRAEEAGVDVNWLRRDMRGLPHDTQYDFVLNLFTAFGLLESDEEDLKVLHEVAAVLRPGGKFILDTLNRECVIADFIPKGWDTLQSGSILIHENKFDLMTGRTFVTRTKIDSDGKREQRQVIVRLYAYTELVKMCREVGLTIVSAYGSFDGTPLALNSRRCIIVAEKR